MSSIIILLGVSATFLGFIVMLLCGIFGMLREHKKDSDCKDENL